MSIEIFYDKFFIKAGDWIIPFVLHGSSNCTMFYNHKEILERDWRVFSPLNHLCVTKTELTAAVDAFWNNDNEFGRWKGKNISGKEFVAMYKRELNKAMSVEDFVALNGRLKLTLNYYENDKSKGYPTLNKDMSSYINTTTELIKWMCNFDEALLSKKYGETTLFVDVLVPHRSITKPIKKPSRAQGSVIAKRGSSYITDYKVGSYISFSNNVDDAIIFPSVEDAHKAIGYRPDIRYVSSDVKNKTKHAQYVLKCKKGSFLNSYVKRKSSKALFFTGGTQFARKFNSEKAAQKYADELKPLYDCEFEIEKLIP